MSLSLAVATRGPIAWRPRCGTAVTAWCSLRLWTSRQLERAANNPWPQWPRVYKMDYGQEEATAVFGEDPREYGIMTKRFIGDEQGNLQAVETVNVRWLPPKMADDRS